MMAPPKTDKPIRETVLPEALAPDIAHILRQTLKTEALISAFQWLIGRIPETSDPTELAEHLADRYEQQVIRLKDGRYKDQLAIFRVGFSAKCIEIMPHFSMKMAQQGYNPQFLKIFFQKRLLANLMGISVADVERRARSSSLKMADYLSDQIHRLYPKCCVCAELKHKL